MTCENSSGTAFTDALRSALGLEPIDENTFDIKITSMAKKSYFQNIEFDEGKKTEVNPYKNFPSNVTVLEPRFEPTAVDTEQSQTHKANVTKTTTPEKPVIKPEVAGLPHASRVLFAPDNVCLEWGNVKRVGAGLRNLGNTCFLNATLQCLTYTAPLYNYFVSRCHRSECKVSGFCMTCELQNHVKHCFENGGKAIKPESILRNLRVIARHMRWGRQEDAHEFLRYVVDAMLKSQLNGFEKLDATSKETTVVHQIFGGYLRSQVACLRCQHKSCKLDPFLDISLDLKNISSVEMGLKKFVEPETLQGKNAYSCKNCKAKVEAKKSFTFHTTPNVLTFQFKRYSEMGGKVSRHIVFSEKLNMRPFMSNRLGSSINYRLYAVLVHDGFSTSSGHYYCYVKAPNNVWQIMNDESVRPVGVNHVLNAQAYLLFYIKEKPSSQLQQYVKNPTNNSTVLLKNGLQKATNCISSAKGISSQNKLDSFLAQKTVSTDKTSAKINGVISHKLSEKSGSLACNRLIPDKKISNSIASSTNGVSVHKTPSKTNNSSVNGVISDKVSPKPNMSENGLSSSKSPSKLNGLALNRSTCDAGDSSNKGPSKSSDVAGNGVSCDSGVALNRKPSKSVENKITSEITPVGLFVPTENKSSPDKKLTKRNSVSEDKTNPDKQHLKRVLSADSASPSKTKFVGSLKNDFPSHDNVMHILQRSNSTEQVKMAAESHKSPSKSADLIAKSLNKHKKATMHCNATTKWKVVDHTDHSMSHKSTCLNATGSWTVTPLHENLSSLTNGNCLKTSLLTAANFAESNLNGISDQEKQNLDRNHQPRLHQQCVSQKWDDVVRTGYKNIRLNSDETTKKTITNWDGQRNRKDFLKDAASVTLAYGAEVVTWDGEKSLLDKTIDDENKKLRKKRHHDEYNNELDVGRTKKFKKPKSDIYDGFNPFQNLQDKANQEKELKLSQIRNMAQTPTFN